MSMWMLVLLFVAVGYVRSQDEGDLYVSTVDSGVQSIIVPMCQNLVSYNSTRLPNRFGHSTQVEVYRHIEHYWAYMDYGCSANFRQFVCSLYLPRYNPETLVSSGPCKETCKDAWRNCRQTMRQTRSRWPRNFRCKKLPSRNSDTDCVAPITAVPSSQLDHTYCAEITIPVCQGLQFHQASLPNFFLQRSTTEIATELGYYDALMASGCSAHLRFFLCGTYMPFCVHNASPFTTPCQELCLEVRANCEGIHSLLYQGLPWPNKLQCHRFPLSDSGRQCVMPTDTP